ncbi:HD-GYP domain-containing protein [Maridesulfovibrio sp.]|uniref:HD-GYP domain-containing protein n=1 Tax=unclassified Maridesulfovibrio TaxID=2794999 RepID=UPI003B00307F
MRGILHYVTTVIVLTIYGGRVCPYLASIDLLSWFVELGTFFAVGYGLRVFLLKQIVLKADYIRQPRLQFITEFSVFIMLGFGVLIYNLIFFDFPAVSGAKVVLGTFTLGLFAAADLALERERSIDAHFRRTMEEITVDENYFPLTRKMALGAIALSVSITGVLFLVMIHDLNWLSRNGDVDDGGALSILKDLGYVMSVYLAHMINLIMSYSHNFKILLGNENKVLRQVASGRLDVFVPVSTSGEFGEMATYTNRMIESLRARTEEIELTQAVTIESLATLAEYRDPETGGHIRRTMNYVRLMAERLVQMPRYQEELDERCVTLLYQSAPLHDIGKVGVPDHILLKPGKLTDEEFTAMKRHPIYGRDTMLKASKNLGSTSFLQFAMEIAYTHHEKWDGSGYPQGLKGEEIPLSGRLMAIADVYDALISKRVYKPPFTHSKAVSIIQKDSGTHFDPELVEVFMELNEDFRQIAIKYADLQEERDALME